MSHLQGTDYVGSMVVLEDGLPRKSEYRRFRIRDVPGNDDYAAMEEVLTRRLTRPARGPGRDQAARTPAAGSARARRFAYPPQLLLLDGGKGQLGVGVRVLERLGLAGEIPVAALAKTFEEVFVPGRPEPVPIPRGSEALFLLQRVRDEAHRFAISYHRDLRGRRMTRSALEGVPGLGPARRARLLRHFGSLRALRARLARGAPGPALAPRRRGRGGLRPPPRRRRPGHRIPGSGHRCWPRSWARMGVGPRPTPMPGTARDRAPAREDGRHVSDYLVITGMSGAGGRRPRPPSRTRAGT